MRFLRGQKPLYFLHIPKTGGTSFAHFLAHQKSGIGPWFPKHQLSDLAGGPTNPFKGYGGIHGHFGTLPYAVIKRPFHSITLLREPLEQTVSYLHFTKRIKDQHPTPQTPPSAALKKKISAVLGAETFEKVLAWPKENDQVFQEGNYLEALPDNPLFNTFYFNQQTRYLGATLDASVLAALTPEEAVFADLTLLTFAQQDLDLMLSRAKKRLEQMVVVGLAEQMQVSCSIAAAYLALPAPEETPALNYDPQRTAQQRSVYHHQESLPPHLSANIRRRLSHDLELYAYGKKLFATQEEALRKGQLKPLY